MNEEGVYVCLLDGKAKWKGSCRAEILDLPRVARAGGREPSHYPLPSPGGCRRILLQEGPGPDLRLPWLLCSENGNGQASPPPC